jgi:hypothetical protein
MSVNLTGDFMYRILWGDADGKDTALDEILKMQKEAMHNNPFERREIMGLIDVPGVNRLAKVYFALAAVAYEPSIAEHVGRRSHPRHFPVFLFQIKIDIHTFAFTLAKIVTVIVTEEDTAGLEKLEWAEVQERKIHAKLDARGEPMTKVVEIPAATPFRFLPLGIAPGRDAQGRARVILVGSPYDEDKELEPAKRRVHKKRFANYVEVARKAIKTYTLGADYAETVQQRHASGRRQ